MDTSNLKPNSHKAKSEQRERQQKIVNGQVKVRKKSGLTKFSDVFISEDAANVKSYILSDVLIPAVKKLISDIVKDGVEMFLYGGTGNRSGSKRYRGDYVSYNKYADDPRDRKTTSRSRTPYSYDDIVLETRGEAEAVLNQLDNILDEYKMVRVADLYDLVGISGRYTDNDYGWTNLRNAEVVRLRDGGYTIRLPRAIPFD